MKLPFSVPPSWQHEDKLKLAVEYGVSLHANSRRFRLDPSTESWLESDTGSGGSSSSSSRQQSAASAASPESRAGSPTAAASSQQHQPQQQQPAATKPGDHAASEPAPAAAASQKKQPQKQKQQQVQQQSQQAVFPPIPASAAAQERDEGLAKARREATAAQQATQRKHKQLEEASAELTRLRKELEETKRAATAQSSGGGGGASKPPAAAAAPSPSAEEKRLTDQLRALEGRYHKLSDEHNQEMQRTAKDHARELHQTGVRIKELEAQLSNYAKMEDDLRTLRASATTLQRELDETKRSLSSAAAAPKDQSEETRRLKDELATLRAEHDADKISFGKRIAALETSETQLRAELKSASGRCGELRATIQQRESEMRAVEDTCFRREKEVGVLNVKLERVTQEHQAALALNKHIEDLAAAKQRLQIENAELASKLESATASSSSSSGARTRAAKAAGDAAGEIAELKAKAAGLQTAVLARDEEAKRLRTSVQSLEAKLAEREEQLHEHKLQSAVAAAELEALRREHADTSRSLTQREASLAKRELSLSSQQQMLQASAVKAALEQQSAVLQVAHSNCMMQAAASTSASAAQQSQVLMLHAQQTASQIVQSANRTAAVLGATVKQTLAAVEAQMQTQIQLNTEWSKQVLTIGTSLEHELRTSLQTMQGSLSDMASRSEYAVFCHQMLRPLTIAFSRAVVLFRAQGNSDSDRHAAARRMAHAAWRQHVLLKCRVEHGQVVQPAELELFGRQMFVLRFVISTCFSGTVPQLPRVEEIEVAAGGHMPVHADIEEVVRAAIVEEPDDDYPSLALPAITGGQRPALLPAPPAAAAIMAAPPANFH